jgi:hypothetical protein
MNGVAVKLRLLWISCGRGDSLIRAVVVLGLLSEVLPALGQKINMFPAAYHEMWTRVAIPPTDPLSDIAQRLIDAKERTIGCGGNGRHELDCSGL